MAKSMKHADAAKKAGILTSTAAIKKSKAPVAEVEVEEELEDNDTTASDTGGSIEVGGPPGKAAPFKALGELDEFGFGSKTETSFVLAMLEEGSFTKPQIIDAFIKNFCVDAHGNRTDNPIKSDIKRKKSSLSVIFSDVPKPFGTYHASRSLIIRTDDDSKVVSLEPKRAALVKKAIKAGILTSLKGFNMKKHEDKVKTVLKKYGLPIE